jgi:hypothetical protein
LRRYIVGRLSASLRTFFEVEDQSRDCNQQVSTVQKHPAPTSKRKTKNPKQVKTDKLSNSMDGPPITKISSTKKERLYCSNTSPNLELGLKSSLKSPRDKNVSDAAKTSHKLSAEMDTAGFDDWKQLNDDHFFPSDLLSSDPASVSIRRLNKSEQGKESISLSLTFTFDQLSLLELMRFKLGEFTDLVSILK